MASNYLVIGCAELGYSKPVLNILNEVAKYTDATVVYAGELSDRYARNMWDRATDRIRTLERKEEEARTTCERKAYKTKFQTITELEAMQQKLIDDLEQVFGKVVWVSNHELYIPTAEVGNRNPRSHLDLSKYITISPVSPNGPRVVGMPITAKSLKNYRFFNNSVIAPHPVFCTSTFAKPGFNKGYQYMTTGALKFPDKAKRASEAYKHCAHPGAVLITVCDITGMFYTTRIAVDQAKNGQLFSVWDGLLFTSGGTKELETKDYTVISSDAQYPFVHKTWELMYQILADQKDYDLAIDLGDLYDFPSLSTHESFGHLSHDGSRLLADIEAGNRGVEMMVKKGNALISIESNHHDRLTRYVKNHKVIKGLVGLEVINNFWLNEGYDVNIREDAPGLDPFQWGDLYTVHGHHWEDRANLIKMAGAYTKVVFGHLHTHMEYMNSILMGCGCGNMAYQPGSNNRWRRQLATASKYRGTTRVHVRPVLEKDGWGSTCFRGKIIRGKI